jgi:5-methylcytosine-specific restriction endonuclease McrA
MPSGSSRTRRCDWRNASSPIDTARAFSYLMERGRAREQAGLYRESQRRYRARLRTDPAAYAAYLERHRASERKNAPRRRAALRSDPVGYARHLQRARARERLRYARVRANWTERQAVASREATRRWRERLKQDSRRYSAFLERRREADRKRYAANRETLLARQRKYTNEHRQEVYARNREWSRKNWAKVSAQRKTTFLKDPDGSRARQRERARARYQRDPQKHLSYMKAWRAANPERARLYVRLSAHRRRAAAGGEFIQVEDWQRLIKKYKGRCAYCNELSPSIEADHRIPLSRGGRNTIANIVPACRRCNRRKRTKTDTEFRAWLKKVG